MFRFFFFAHLNFPDCSKECNVRTLCVSTSLFSGMSLTKVLAEQITGRRVFPLLSDGAACLRHSRVPREVVVEEKNLWGRS